MRTSGRRPVRQHAAPAPAGAALHHSPTGQLMRPSSSLAADREAVTAYLLAAVPGLNGDGASGVLQRAGAAGTGSLRQIAAHLARHPDPLRTHRQDIPPGLIRLAWRLHADGHDWVIAPRCAGCGKITAALNSLSPAGRICVTCKARARRTECARCGRTAAPAARRPDGLICATCYDREPSRIKPCGQCGQPAQPACPRHHPDPARRTTPMVVPRNDPTGPASHAHLRTGLSRHGITTHAARNTVIGTLAAELPAPILASITGLNINTATRWTRSTSHDWTDYLAARTPPPDEMAGDEDHYSTRVRQRK